jgi:hypothetical protein
VQVKYYTMMLSQGFHPLHRDNAIECGGSGGGTSARRLLAPDIRFFATVEDKITVFGSTSTSTPHSSSSSCAGEDDCEEMSDSEQCPTVVMLSQKRELPVETTSNYNRMDVLLGRGRAFQLYPGNRRFHGTCLCVDLHTVGITECS